VKSSPFHIVSMSRPSRSLVFAAIALATAAVASTANAQQAISQRLMAETVALDSQNIQTQIWSDKMRSIIANRRALQKAAPSAHLKLIGEFFTTAFSANGHKYVVSVINNDCSSSSAAPNSLFCPARVADVSNGQLRIVGDLPEFQISAVRGNAGYDASSNAQTKFMTIASFDSKSNTINFTDVSDGQQSPLNVTVNLR
jgi:hypothetical protein